MDKKDIWLGKTFGKYKVIKSIGRGTLGRVYQALAIDSQKIFAIKIFDVRLSQVLKQKWNELESVRNLKNENIVEIYEKGEEYGTFYLIMDYIDGYNLQTLIDEKKQINYTQVLEIAKGITKALIYANKYDIIHRDIKPTNILLTKTNKVVITDFSTTRMINSVSDVSELDKFISTVFYVSPEQAMGIKKIDHRTDFYSLGITLFQALTGEVPYPGRTPLQVLQQHISAPLPRLNKYNCNVPSEIEKLIQKLTAKKKEDRFTTAEEVFEGIQQCEQKIQKKSKFLPILPAWLIGVIVFVVLFFVSFSIAEKIFNPSQINNSISFEIKNVQVNGSNNKISPFTKEDIICITLEIFITKISSQKMLVVTFKNNDKIYTKNTDVSSLGKQTYEHCFSASELPVGKHETKISAFVEDVANHKTIGFEIHPKVEATNKVKLKIKPENVVISPNQQELFYYEVVGQQNENILPIYWECSGGKIENGLYTAGTQEGEFFISILDENKTIRARTTVVIKKDSNNKGWFGEKIPIGLVKSRVQGEYIWTKDNSIMVFVPQGKFWLGSNEQSNEGPVQEVYIESFYIDKYEVTKKQYEIYCQQVKQEIPEQPKWSSANHPIVNISWEEAFQYAQWVGKRLPNEKEWEKAAKGGSQIPDWMNNKEIISLMLNPRPRRLYPWGDQSPNEGIEYRCNYVANDIWEQKHLDGYKEGAPVYAFPRWKSPYGCLNLAGNVWEWCKDGYSQSYSEAPKILPNGKWKKVLRGGSWWNHAMACRTTRRHYGSMSEKSEFIGMRLAK